MNRIFLHGREIELFSLLFCVLMSAGSKNYMLSFHGIFAVELLLFFQAFRNYLFMRSKFSTFSMLIKACRIT